ncbi:MAG: SDR family oxidoreductase [Gemmatimonadetes bacterium]|jgi:NAD(P)-dependent dehydrogenase (short-subunit alcohol dehydrogenase family)|nr:SDR family oxidoreductase [Gemmatimonadota bacterium]MBT6143853.1 SDR family oxidoreductase [Gemmatimonadota bacterium]
MRLAEKRAVVTGAASGIGRATATRFAQEGARVVLADIHREAGLEATAALRADGYQVTFIEVDVTDVGQVGTLVTEADDWLGGIDVWMNNAGASLTEDLLEVEVEDWMADLKLNLTSHYLCTKAALPVMIRDGGGSLINTSSVNGLWAIGEVGYSSAKAGLISFTKNVAVTYGRQGIRANVICPGTIDTPRGGAYWDDKAGGKDKLLKWYPVGRLGEPEDVAALAVYLASDEAGFMSGSTLVIDGGLTAGTVLFGDV